MLVCGYEQLEGGSCKWQYLWLKRIALHLNVTAEYPYFVDVTHVAKRTVSLLVQSKEM